MLNWQTMDNAPKDGRWVLVLTADFGIVQARWDSSAINFYSSQEGWASYDPDNAKGEWISDWQISGDGDKRLYCGATPEYWSEIGELPKAEQLGPETADYNGWFFDCSSPSVAA